MTSTIAPARTGGGYGLTHYIAMDFWRNLRNVGNSFFVIVLPTVLFLFFGASMEWSDEPVASATPAPGP
ncbi:hypothetical protein [Saccharomonospora sp. CUA-673]|uniref:hypothetical protein n=1 Tax=Saccharomonospora sp. CUA-673 TaxID=1904969 RepID=UPI001C9E2294|nr:hypothetical protein [Saccharomonospora sp. CUA-673]